MRNYQERRENEKPEIDVTIHSIVTVLLAITCVCLIFALHKANNENEYLYNRYVQDVSYIDTSSDNNGTNDSCLSIFVKKETNETNRK